MAKKLSNRAKRRKLERDLAKGKTSKGLNNSQLLFNLKYVLNEIQATTLLKTLPKEKVKEVFGNQLPKKYTELRNEISTYPKNDFAKEIFWYTNDFIELHEHVNSFLKMQNTFECNFLAGNYIDARKSLEQIEQIVCVSQWGIEKNLLLGEYETGFKRNKEILTEIIDNQNNQLTNLLSKYQSIRVEKNLSYFKYEEIIQKLINPYKDISAKEYLYFKLDFFNQSIYSNKGFILSIENPSSLIDKYESFIQLILLSLSENDISDETLDIIKGSLNKLIDVVEDNRIINSLLSLGEKPQINVNNQNLIFLKIIDLYSCGKYDSAINELRLFLPKNANQFDLYEIYIRAIIFSNKEFVNLFNPDTIAGKCLESLYNIFSKNEKTQTSLIQSEKIYNSIGNCTWSYKYFTLIKSEYSVNHDFVNTLKYSSLSSQHFSPSVALYIKDKTTLKYFLTEIKRTDFFITANLYEQITNVQFNNTITRFSGDIDPFISELYYAKAIQSIGNHDIALESYYSILNNPNFETIVHQQHSKLEIVYGILTCLLELGNIKDAVVLVARENISNPNFSNKLRSLYLINQLINNDDDEIFQEISTSIFLHQYQININPNDLWITYDNFLSSHGLSYPKEIESIIEKFEINKVVYFLKHICKQEVFDSSYLFETQDELDNERIEICSILTRFDSENFEEYINEISEINRSILIRKGIKQMDESKIYVDVKGIKRSIYKDIKESFDRSLNLLNLSLDQIQKLDLESENVIIPYYGKSSETKKVEFSDSNIKITSYSRFQQFLDIFYKIRDKFIASNEFGIDTYLSMRIRHGTLLGEIRSVFENNFLVTKKEDNSPNYKNNIYWNKLKLSSPDIERDFKLILADFSKKIDDISEELKNKKIQIKTERRESEGFFDYSFDDNELLKIFRDRVGAIEDFDEFFEEIINILWERTELNLFKIRDDISENIKPTMVKLLVKLSEDIEILIQKSDYPEVNELIRNITICQTDIKNELDKVASWFKRTNSKTINEFFIQLPIDSTLTTLKRLFKDYNNLGPVLNIDCDVKFEGEFFPHFSYIFQNLLHNVIQHSKLEYTKLKVRIDVKEFENNLSIIIQNNFSETINLDDLNIKIHKTRQSLLQSIDNDRIRAEEGTGYLKIQKTLKSDLSRDSFRIDIDNVDNNRIFKTEINFSITNLQKS